MRSHSNYPKILNLLLMIAHFPASCKGHAVDYPVATAIAFGDARHVIDYYSNWRGSYLLSDYQRSIAQSLKQTAQLPSTPQTTIIIDFLLSKLDPTFIDRVDCLLDAAVDKVDKGHTELIKYIKRTFTYPFTEWALVEAISENKPHKVDALLQAGIDPNIGIGNQDQAQVVLHDDAKLAFEEYRYGRYPLHMAAHLGQVETVNLLLTHNANVTRLDHYHQTPLFAALQGFSDKDTESITKNRLYIVRRLLEAMPADMRPLPIQTESFNLTPSARGRVRNLLQSFLPQTPARVRMTDEVVSLTSEQFEELDRKLTQISIGLSAVGAATCICIHKKCCKTAKEKEPKKQKAAPITVKVQRKTK